MSFLSGIGKAISGIAGGIGSIFGGPLGGSLISAGTSLLGGMLDRNAQRDAQAQQNRMNDPVYVRQRAEAAGFNPILFAGTGLAPGSQYAPSMGDSIARAGAALADGMSEERQLQMQMAELEQENQRLETLAQMATLTPDVPGIYGGGHVRQRVQGDYGGAAGGVAVSDGAGRSDFGDGDRLVSPDTADAPLEGPIFAPDREVQRDPTVDGPGITIIDNELTGELWVPGADGEPWGIDELATAAVVGWPQWMWNAGKADYLYWRDKARGVRARREPLVGPIYQHPYLNDAAKPRPRP